MAPLVFVFVFFLLACWEREDVWSGKSLLRILACLQGPGPASMCPAGWLTWGGMHRDSDDRENALVSLHFQGQRRWYTDHQLEKPAD